MLVTEAERNEGAAGRRRGVTETRAEDRDTGARGTGDTGARGTGTRAEADDGEAEG